jgi:aryl-phospho-beta-D-glucosidase BglC (GH1 family)
MNQYVCSLYHHHHQSQAIDPAIKGLNNFHSLDVFLNKAADHGILVLLDMHLLDPAESISPLWYDDNHSKSLLRS